MIYSSINRLILHSCKQCIYRNHNLVKFNSNLTSNTLKILNRRSATLINPEPLNEISSTARKSIGIWLLACSGVTFGTVIVGGVTRLTHSGLSMVDWHPFKEFPPTSHSQWIEEFEKYKQFPEYKVTNKDMTLDQFKWIWYMEFAHRTLGRTIGALFFIPATFFWYKKWLTKAMKKRTLIFGALLGFQGLLGWYMVKSGLEEKQEFQREPRVSHYRLAAHLGTAFVFYSLLLWSSLTHLLPPQPTQVTQKLRVFRRFAHSTKAIVFLTALSGAFVAGLDAGLVYNSWPLMADKWIPDDINAKNSFWENIFENPTTVQFNHRMLGEVVFCAVAGLWVFSRRLNLNPRTRLAINSLMFVTLIKVRLGIANLIYYVRSASSRGPPSHVDL